MPANLPPQYFEAERVYKQAKDSAEKIAALEDMLAIMPKHKGTDHLRAELRTRIAKLHQSGGKKLAAQRASFAVEPEGAAQVAVIGLANSGKSSLVAALTNASPVVAEYPFSTQNALPGMMTFENIAIQLVDTPPLSVQNMPWWLTQIIRSADGLVIMIDLGSDPAKQLDEVTGLLDRMHVQLEDNQAETGLFKKSLIAAAKMDLDKGGEQLKLLKSLFGQTHNIAATSTELGIGLKELGRKLFDTLQIIRVYTKAPGNKADLDDPIVLPRESTLMDAAVHLHKDFGRKLKYARLWGSGKHEGIMVKKDHLLADGDIIELHI